MKYIPMLDDTLTSPRWCAFDEWWSEIVFKDDQGSTLTRGDLIRTVRDQDGGGHVDSSLESTYARLSRENSLGWVMQKENSPTPILNAEMAALRQIGHEILKTLLPDYKRKPVDDADFFFGGSMVTPGAKPPPLPKRQKIGMNSSCPCGARDENGKPKKFKRCHGK